MEKRLIEVSVGIVIDERLWITQGTELHTHCHKVNVVAENPEQALVEAESKLGRERWGSIECQGHARFNHSLYEELHSKYSK